jgi:hypothetical protein
VRLRVYKRRDGRCFGLLFYQHSTLKEIEEEESYGAGDPDSGLRVGQLVLALTQFILSHSQHICIIFHLFY